MPAHPHLSEGEVDVLVGFLRGIEDLPTTEPSKTPPYVLSRYERFVDGEGKAVMQPPGER
ncbi:MAG: hypothetical protein ACI80V_001986 [Rhodothermales bacterium]|jgi:hypothetical protein